MSIQTEINRINESKVDIAQAAINFGLDVPDGSKINDYAEAILVYSQTPKKIKYEKVFKATTSISISASDHGISMPVIDVYVQEGSSYVKTSGYPTNGYKVTVSSAGDITVTFGVATAGKIVVT